ncbi:MFS transporter [Nonomuraea polychroma]|uniref:MFS transporter n=1 Tax=Nonomuraea polychroma TaxID=46176 RepID=UPI003D945DBA
MTFRAERLVAPSGGLTATLALLSFVVPLSTDIYLPGFPAMARELNTDAAGVRFTLTAFLVELAAGQLVLGPLADRYGRRKPILIGAGVCTLATALSTSAAAASSSIRNGRGPAGASCSGSGPTTSR